MNTINSQWNDTQDAAQETMRPPMLQSFESMNVVSPHRCHCIPTFVIIVRQTYVSTLSQINDFENGRRLDDTRGRSDLRQEFPQKTARPLNDASIGNPEFQKNSALN